jgi:alpha-N-arabinofuranosidase
MPTFGSWESAVLEHAYELVDYISLHAYYQEHDEDADSLGDFLASSADMDAFIAEVTATADAVGARLRSRRKLRLSFDEWNVWYQSRFPGVASLPWEQAPRLIEDDFSAVDAVVVGSFLITLLRHADRVAVACQAQLANIIAPIRTEPGGPAWRQSIFHPFAQTARLARGDVLRLEAAAPAYDTARHGRVSTMDAVATRDPETGDVALFVVHRGQNGDLPLEVDLRALPGLAIAEHLVLGGQAGHLRDVNTAERPDRVAARLGTGARIDDGRLTAGLPPVSWTVFRLAEPETRTSDGRSPA